jgi:hypothetical protein
MDIEIYCSLNVRDFGIVGAALGSPGQRQSILSKKLGSGTTRHQVQFGNAKFEGFGAHSGRKMEAAPKNTKF